MSITVLPLGGVGEVGRNCIAIGINNKWLLLDMGFHLERFIEVTEDDFPKQKNSLRKLLSSGALPDIRYLRRYKKDVIGILCSHAHLDHIGAIPFIAKKFKCPIYATPFTGAVIRSLREHEDLSLQLKLHNPGDTFVIGEFTIEFIPVAHSTPQSVMIVIHTPDGSIVYANDYKNDQTPPFEQPTDMNRIKKLSGNVKLLILDSLYAPTDSFCPSEAIAREAVLSLKDELSQYRTIVASTFSSQIARLQSFCDLADSLNRKVVFLGRSLVKYIGAAKDAGVVDLSTRGEMFKYARQINSFLAKLSRPQDYFIVTTGHQGEPGAVLSRMSKGTYNFSKKDVVLFSCTVIPTPITQANREILESALSKIGVTLIKDVHVSGHAYGKDHEQLISILKPEFLLPMHGEDFMEDACKERALNCGLDGDHILKLEVGEKKRLS